MAVNNLNIPGVGIQPSLIDAKGDLLVGTANDAVGILGVTGPTGSVLVTDAGETTGLKWVDPGSVGGLVHINTVDFTGVASFSLPDDTFTSEYNVYKIIFSNFETTASTNINFRFRKAGADNSTASSYKTGGSTTPYSGSILNFVSVTTSALISQIGAANSNSSLDLTVYDPKLNRKTEYVTFSTSPTNAYFVNGIHDVVDDYDSMTFIFSSGNGSGTYSVYGLRK